MTQTFFVFGQSLVAAIALAYGTAFLGLWLQYRRETMRAFAIVFAGFGTVSGLSIVATLRFGTGAPSSPLSSPEIVALILAVTVASLAVGHVAHAVLDPTRSRRYLPAYGVAIVVLIGTVVAIGLSVTLTLLIVITAALGRGLYLAWRAEPSPGRRPLVSVLALIMLRRVISLLLAAGGPQGSPPSWYVGLQATVMIGAGFFATVCIFAIERAEAVRQPSKVDAEMARTLRMESLGRMASGVAHDFNNILFVIQSSGWHALENAKAGKHDEAHTVDFEAAVQSGTELVASLVNFAKRGAASGAEHFDVGRRLDELFPILQRLVGNGIELKLDIEPAARSRATVACDAVQFDHALMNLAANARDAMAGTGQLRLHLSICAPSARPPGLPDVPFLMLRVTDTGAGIAEAVQDRVFEPFFTTKDENGTGLGLASAQAFVLGANGAIDVQSTIGQGTTFRIFLPLV